MCTWAHMGAFGSGQVFWLNLILFLILSPMSSLKVHCIPIRFPWTWLTSSHSFVSHVFSSIWDISITCFCQYLAYPTRPISHAMPSMKPLLKIASIILSLLWKKPFLNDYLNHSFFTLNSHDTSLYFCYTHHIPPCLICSLFLLSCKLLENMDNLLHIFFSFFFSYQPLYKVLHHECNWYSLKCLQWRNKRMNKCIAIRKAFVLDTLFALHPSPLCSGHWEIKLCWLHQPLFPSGFQLTWPMRSTTRNMKVREKKRRSIYPPFSLWAKPWVSNSCISPHKPTAPDRYLVTTPFLWPFKPKGGSSGGFTVPCRLSLRPFMKLSAITGFECVIYDLYTNYNL